MADVSAALKEFDRNQTIMRSFRDQMVSETMAYLHERGEDWTQNLDRLTMELMDEFEEPFRTIGKLAQIGFLTVFGDAVLESS